MVKTTRLWDRRTYLGALGLTTVAGCMGDDGDGDGDAGDDDGGSGDTGDGGSADGDDGTTDGGDPDDDDGGDDADDTGEPDDGSSDDDGDDPGGFPTFDIPAYSEWPPAEPRMDDFVRFTHVNVQHLQGSGEGDNGDDGSEPPEDDVMPMLWLPLYGLITTAFAFGLGLWTYPWSDALGSDDEPDGMDTAAITMTEGVFIFQGEYDPDTFAAEYADEFDERTVNGFTVFEGQPDGPTAQHAYAVSEEAVIALNAPETMDDHDAAIALFDEAVTHRVEGGDRISDDEDGAWLFESTGDADIATGFWEVGGLATEHLDLEEEQDNNGDDEPDIGDTPVFGQADSLISTISGPETIDGVEEDLGAARFAALYPQGEVPSDDEIREGLTGDNEEAELEIVTGDDRVHVTFEGEE